MRLSTLNALNRLDRACNQLGYELLWYKNRSLGGLEISIRNSSKHARIGLYLTDELPVRRGLTDAECIRVLSHELPETGLHKSDQKAVQELLGVWLHGLAASISFFMKKLNPMLTWQDICKIFRISLQYGISVNFPYCLAKENPYTKEIHWVLPPELQLLALDAFGSIENLKQYKEGFKHLLTDALKPSVKLIPPDMIYEISKKLSERIRQKYRTRKEKDQRDIAYEWEHELLNALKDTLLIFCASTPKLRPLILFLHFLH